MPDFRDYGDLSNNAAVRADQVLTRKIAATVDLEDLLSAEAQAAKVAKRIEVRKKEELCGRLANKHVALAEDNQLFASIGTQTSSNLWGERPGGRAVG